MEEIEVELAGCWFTVIGQKEFPDQAETTLPRFDVSAVESSGVSGNLLPMLNDNAVGRIQELADEEVEAEWQGIVHSRDIEETEQSLRYAA